MLAAALRRERDHAGLSLTELARRAGVAKSTLSQLESGNGNPGVETLWSLAVALDVPFSRLVDRPRPQVRVLRAADTPYLHSEQANYAAALLSAGPPNVRRDLHLLALEPGNAREADAHLPGTVEHLLVAAGRMRSGPSTDPVELEPGDYLSFPGDVAHLYEALAEATRAVLIMEYA